MWEIAVFLNILEQFAEHCRYIIKMIDKKRITDNNNLREPQSLCQTFGGGFVANTMDNGKIFGFNYSEKELSDKITQYKDQTKAGDIMLPSWPDFCSFVDCDSDVLEDVMDQGMQMTGSVRSAYYNRALMLKSMRRWCEAQLVSNPNWGGKMGVKSMMLLKQGFGGGRKYLDERTAKPTGPSEIKVSFGGEDPRAKKASK